MVRVPDVYKCADVLSEMEEITTPMYSNVCMCLYTAYLVLTRHWRKVDENLDGIPDSLQGPAL